MLLSHDAPHPPRSLRSYVAKISRPQIPESWNMANTIDSFAPVYEYEPLDLTKEQIRLVTLKHGSEGSPIECDLQVFDRKTSPQYVALSYTWGEPTPLQTILVNHRRFSVRKNLYDFLRCYRNDKSNVYHIWIDQICISQALHSERNHQVRLMAHIYGCCVHAIVWLGEDSEQYALDFNQRRGSGRQLAANPYFTRLWIIQEYVLSPRQHILCGGTWVDGEDLGHYLNAIVENAAQGDAIVTAYYLLHGDYTKSFEMENALELFAKQRCEDIRDKVYGLMSLIQQSERVVVDYQRSTEEVFLDVVFRDCKRIFPSIDWLKGSSSSYFRGAYLLLDLSRMLDLGAHEGTIERLLLSLNDISPANIRQYGFYKSDASTRESFWWYIRDRPRVLATFSASGTRLVDVDMSNIAGLSKLLGTELDSKSGVLQHFICFLKRILFEKTSESH